MLRVAAIAAALGAGSGAAAFAQAAPDNTAAPTDSDPTRPVLFSVRPEFLKAADGIWRMQFIARYDMATMRNRRWLGGRRGILLRAELPTAGADSPGSDAHVGLGDAYAQLLLVPYTSGRWAFAAGSGLLLPTATSQPLGTGKWTLAPLAVPIYVMRGVGMTYVKLQDLFSVAGDEARPDAHVMLITPTVIHTMGSKSWLLADTETKTDWRRDRRTGIKSGLQFGHILADGIGLWIKPEVWWGPNRDGQWNLKTGIVWYRTATRSS